jgi:phytanoyl-CoA dioxygenase PhyH
MSGPLISNGKVLESGVAEFGGLVDSSGLLGDIDRAREQMMQEGYLLLRGFLSRETVLAAREEILFKFAIVGEIDSINHPLMDGVLSDESYIVSVNAIAFTESLRRGVAYTNVVLSPRLLDFFSAFLGGPACSFDFRWPRFMRLGESTGIHCDGPYITRGTRNVWSAWIPLGDVPLSDGPIMLLEHSHLNEQLRQSYGMRDADLEKMGWLSTDPVELRRQLGGRWLSTDFQAGDVLLFGPDLVHASLENRSPQGHCRLSSDTRYQLASDPLDERYNGPNTSNPHGGPRRVFLPGKAPGNNQEFQDEWKLVDERGRLVTVDANRESLLTHDSTALNGSAIP